MTAVPAGEGAVAGGEVRPRGRRFSGNRPEHGPQGARKAGHPGSGSRPRSGRIPADIPTAAALDTISLARGERRSTAPQAAEVVVGSAASGPRTPAPATEVPSEPIPVWPVFWRGGSQPGADHEPPGAGADSILPGVGSAGRQAADGDAGPDAAMAPRLLLLDACRAVLAWARGRHLGPSSATGISVALALCAAAWLSAGTTADTDRGVAALWCSYLILVGGRIANRQAARADADHRATGPARWLAALGGSVAEAAVYAGLAAGASAQRYPGMWALGVAAIGLITVRNLMTACSVPYGLGQPSDSPLGRICAAVVTMAPGGRILVVGFVAAFWDARTALLVLVAWAISSVGYGLAGRALPVVAAKSRDGDGSAVPSAAAPRLRDDGAIARYLGALVRGSLLPLPPAVLGLAAVTAFAVLGLHGAPGRLLFAPAFVMLLAAPGSANPHLGRLDWVVPVLLVSSQVVYFWAVGTAGQVPGPVVFALVAALLVWYTDLVCAERPVLLVRPRRPGSAPREYGAALGWEGRLLFIGVSAALGIATAGYLVLTIYLVLLISAKAIRSCVLSPEDHLALWRASKGLRPRVRYLQ